MAYEVNLAQPARDALDNTVVYLSQVLASPQAAKTLLNVQERTTSILETFPRAYPLSFQACNLIGREVRKAPIGNYRQYYYIDDTQNRVVIFAFLHARQNPITHLTDFAITQKTIFVRSLAQRAHCSKTQNESSKKPYLNISFQKFTKTTFLCNSIMKLAQLKKRNYYCAPNRNSKPCWHLICSY